MLHSPRRLNPLWGVLLMLTKATKAKLHASRVKMWKNKAYRKQRHIALKRAWDDPELKAAQSARIKEQWASGKRSKAKMSVRLKKQWADPTSANNQREYDPAVMGAMAKKAWGNPESRAVLLASRQKSNSDPVKRAANSARIKAKWTDPKYRAKVMRTRRRTMYNNPEWKKNISISNKAGYTSGKNVAWNKGLTKETHSSLASSSAKLKGKIPDYGKYRAWYHGVNCSIRMRSKWEVAYAQYLDRNGIAWEYEPCYFTVGKGKWNGETYIPDFYLCETNTYIEIKGRLSVENKAKYKAFCTRYPKIKLQMLFGPDLKRLGVINMYKCAVLR
jgi:hypothetical protein